MSCNRKNVTRYTLMVIICLSFPNFNALKQDSMDNNFIYEQPCFAISVQDYTRWFYWFRDLNTQRQNTQCLTFCPDTKRTSAEYLLPVPVDT